jgi:hypothetical protein
MLRISRPVACVGVFVALVFAAPACSSSNTPQEEDVDAATPIPTGTTTATTPVPGDTDAALDSAVPAALPKGQIVFSSFGAIKLVGIGGAQPTTAKVLVEANGAGNYENFMPSFLPDGRVVYARFIGTGFSRTTSLRAVSADGSGDSELVAFPAEGSFNATNSPVAASDGRIYFVRGVGDTDGIRAKVMSVPSTGGVATDFVSLPPDCESLLLTASSGGNRLLVRYSNTRCSAPGFALLTPSAPPGQIVTESAPKSSAIGFDETGSRLWIVAGTTTDASLQKVDLEGKPDGVEAKISIASLPARIQGIGPSSMFFFGSPVGLVRVSGTSATLSELPEADGSEGANFRATP